MGDLDAAHAALNRMRRAYDRGTGCHLTAEMIAVLSVTFLGELWDEDEPVALTPTQPEPTRGQSDD